MRRWLSIVALIVSAGAEPVSAQSPELPPPIKRAVNSFAHEHAICAAYYAVAAKCLSASNDMEMRDKISKVGSGFISRGREYTKVAGLRDETFGARMEMAAKQMSSTMGDDCSNISLVLNEHALSCKALFEEPEKRIDALMNEMVTRDREGR